MIYEDSLFVDPDELLNSRLPCLQERAVKVGKLEHYWRIIAPPVAGAPYDCLPNLLHTQVRNAGNLYAGIMEVQLDLTLDL